MTPEAEVMEALFRVSTKDGDDVDFVLNSAQRKIDKHLTGRDLVPKARQEGVSTYFLARFTVACMMHRNVRAVVISHDLESTQRQLSRVKYFLKNIKGPQPVIQNMSKNEITFPKMDSAFYLGTAGARKFGRGDTITHLHCSEFAFWPNAHELMVGLLQAVPASGQIAIESTGNGMNDYYSRCMRAEKGQTGWTNHFLPWHTFEEYTVDISEEQEEEVISTLDDQIEEDKLVGFLTPGQLLWRRRKIEDLDFDLRAFKQEYPMTLDECFQASGDSIFYKVNYQPTDDWGKEDANFSLLRGHPDPDKSYILGADVSGGVGKDFSAVQILCLNDMEQVGEYTNNKVAPDRFAETILGIARRFNNAYVVVEQNNHGLVTLSYIRDECYKGNYLHSSVYRETTGSPKQPLLSMGYKTTARTKPLMIGILRKSLATTLLIHSPVLNAELSTFVETETGALEASSGCHDDTVIAMACASLGVTKASLLLTNRNVEARAAEDSNPFLFDNILKELKNRHGNFPIKPQHRGAYQEPN